MEHVDIAARENHLIVLSEAPSEGAVFTQDPVTRERLWLGWLKELDFQELVTHPKFSLERHLDLWVDWTDDTNRAEVKKDPSESGHPDGAQGFDAFISYDGDDWQEVKSIAEELEGMGVRLFQLAPPAASEA